MCYFATDIHSKTLALGKNDDSLERAGDVKGELLMVSAGFVIGFGVLWTMKLETDMVYLVLDLW